MGTISDLNFEAGITGLTGNQAMVWGFRSGDRGTHTSRTIMLDELLHLLDAAPGEVCREDYAAAVTENNCLGKRTAATRKLSLQRLTELYGLDTQLILFRVLRDLWGRHEGSRPLLAMLLALARDPLLRATATAVIRTPYGHEFARQSMRDTLSEAVCDRLNDATLDKVVVMLLPRGLSPVTFVAEGEDQAEGGCDAGYNHVRIAAWLRCGPPWPTVVRNALDRDPGFRSR